MLLSVSIGHMRFITPLAVLEMVLLAYQHTDVEITHLSVEKHYYAAQPT